MSGTDTTPYAYAIPCPPRFAISLRVCYALSGTDFAYAALSLRVSLPSTAVWCNLPTCVPGTDLGHSTMCVRTCYAVCSAKTAYGTTRRPPSTE
eukprot:443595-Rhodomonas_salina.1